MSKFRLRWGGVHCHAVVSDYRSSMETNEPILQLSGQRPLQFGIFEQLRVGRTPPTALRRFPIR